MYGIDAYGRPSSYGTRRPPADDQSQPYNAQSEFSTAQQGQTNGTGTGAPQQSSGDINPLTGLANSVVNNEYQPPSQPSQQPQSPTPQAWNPTLYYGSGVGRQSDYQTQLANYYNQYLGRTPSYTDYQAHAGSPSYYTLQNTIQYSPEALARAASQSVNSPTSPTAPSYDTSGWNTDGFATPAYVAQNAGAVMPGWDQTKWLDNTHQTPKYVVGRILSQFSPSIDGLRQAVAQIQQAYPGATWDGKDKVTIPGVGTIDVLTGASAGDPSRMTWWWGDTAGAAPSQQTGITNVPGTSGATGGAANPLWGASGISYGGIDRFGGGRGGTNTGMDLTPPTYGGPSYTPTVYDDGGLNAALRDSAMGILADPGFGPDWVIRQKEMEKEAALANQESALAALAQNAASRGAMGGNYDATTRRVRDAAMSEMMGGYRTAEQTAEENRARAIINAMNAAGGVGSALWRQYMDAEGLNQAAVQDAQTRYGLDLNAWNAGNQAVTQNLANQLSIKQFEDAMAQWRAALAAQYGANALNTNTAIGQSFLR